MYSFRTSARSLALLRRAPQIAVALVFAAVFVLTGCDGDGGMETTPNPTITELAGQSSNLSTLASALEQAGLDDDLNGDGPFTVFAPANPAFEAIDASELTGNDELLQEVLTYHVVPQEITAGDIQDGQLVQTLEGDTLRFSVDGNTVRVNGATVTSADLQASNGVVHVIDGVLLETVTATDRAILAPSLSTSAQAIAAAGLGDDLRGEGPFTIFAPVNSAFEGLETGALVGDTGLLTSVLQYHVVSGARVTSDQITNDTDPTTLEGGTLDLQVGNDGTVTVNGIPVSTADVEASNGVIHLIDGVLLQRINAVQRATVTSDFTILADLVAQTNLASALSGPGPDGMDGITVFGPTNDAFLRAFDSNGDGELQDSELPSDPQSVLEYHVLDDVFFAADVPTSEQAFTTLQGDDVTLVRSGSDVSINPSEDDASVIAADVDVSNGVIHGIDTVLRPPSQQSTSDVTVTIENVGADAWVVNSVYGSSGVSDIDSENSTLTLTVGTRYRFENLGGSSHPFGLQDASDSYLLNQNGNGSLEGNSGINWQEDADGVTFTYTQTLADQVATYRCTIHASMEGTVETAN